MVVDVNTLISIPVLLSKPSFKNERLMAVADSETQLMIKGNCRTKIS